MKGLGMIALLAGLICLGIGGYGALAVQSAGSEFGFTLDSAAAFSRALGLDAYMTVQERFMLFAVINRTTLLIAGAALAVIGFAVRRSAVMKGA